MTSASIDAMLADLEIISDLVMSIVVPTKTTDRSNFTTPISLMVRHHLVGGQSPLADRDVRALVDRLKACASALCKVGSGRKLLADRQLMRGIPAAPYQANQFYVELLTAVSLGLYFLGVPIGEPWDLVQTWADEEGGGLPNGICVAKAIGDIVRSSRKWQPTLPVEADANERAKRRASTDLIVHSFLPMILFRDLILWGGGQPEPENAGLPEHPSIRSQTATGPSEGDESDERSLLVPSIHALGRCYEVLQLQLYLRAGYPIYYAVPEDILKAEILRSCAAGKSTEVCWEEMCAFLRDKIFRGKLPDAGNLQRQCVYVIDRTKPPACFINHDAGLLTFEGIDLDVGSRELPLPANYMLDERRERYRKRVLSFKPADDDAALRNLLNGAKNKELFKHIFHGSKDGHPDPAHGKDAANDAAKGAVTVR
ncbi:hypothetical protein [Paraburkholderia atlantica]|uniref:hypothetical protein n=1 Tax=Paraburkholderia atlantica TaxID=2654982 RepID=UPI003D21C53A